MGPPNTHCKGLGLAPKPGALVGHFAHSTAVSHLVPRLAAPAHLAQAQKWQNQPKCCATTLWGGNLAVVWGSGSQHGRFERYDKIGKMPLKKKTLDLATKSQKMRKIEIGQKRCATRVCLHMVKQRWANQHPHLQHTRHDNQNVQFWATLAQNTSELVVAVMVVFSVSFSVTPRKSTPNSEAPHRRPTRARRACAQPRYECTHTHTHR